MRNERRCRAFFSLSLLPILSVLLFSLPAGAELIDRVVASVNNDVITWSELNQAVGFNAALGGGGGGELRAQTLEGLINRRLLVQEARRLKFVEISEQDVDAETNKLRERLGSEKAFTDLLGKLDMTGGQLRRMLAERLLVERHVEKKVGLFIRVTRDEAEAYFNRNPGRFRGKRFSEVQKAITAGLQEQQLDQQMTKYLAELRSKADVRMAPE
ncbi:MAG: hypothetical protein A2078_10555 [Nitrospirae bacterium GWC2_57_9]|nr:MAG: hypothetical protein A2078_10555 [Nitrospirae bacterium GWC2_57_9]